MKIVQGNQVPIEIQLQNYDATKYPTAIIRNQSGSIISTLNLNHEQNGLYRPATTFQMTSDLFLSVQYIIYEDAARTEISKNAGGDLEFFVRESVHEIVWDEPIASHQTPGSTGETLGILEALDLDALLSRILVSDVIAKVESDESLHASVELELSSIIASSFDAESIIGIVGESEEIKSNIDGNGEIIGVTNEC